MSEADFNLVASQLLKDIGVKDTTTLDFFQNKPQSAEWKSSIKAPSPPKNRRTASSGMTRTRQNIREGQQQNGIRKSSIEQQEPIPSTQRKFSGEHNGTNIPQRKHSGEKVLRGPQYYSAGQPSSKQPARTDGRFGYGVTAFTHNGTHAQPTPVTSPTRRVIARPAPKRPTQPTTTIHAKTSDTTIKQAPTGNTSSAGAVLHSQSSKPLNVRVATAAEHKAISVNSNDDNKPSKEKTALVKSKEPVRRIASNPDCIEQSKTTVEVVQTRPASFQVISTSSHRILHTSEDGGSSRRKPSLKTGYYNGTRSVSMVNKPQPVKAMHFTRPSSKSTSTQKEMQPADTHNSGIYNSLSPPLSPIGLNPSSGAEKTSKQEKQPSEIQSLSGAYDRLSPIELAGIRQISEEPNTISKKSDSQTYQQTISTSTSSDHSHSVSQVPSVYQKKWNGMSSSCAISDSFKSQRASDKPNRHSYHSTNTNVDPSISHKSLNEASSQIIRRASNTSTSSESSHYEEKQYIPHHKLSTRKSHKTNSLPVTSERSSIQKPVRRHSSADYHTKSTFTSTSAIPQHSKVGESRLERNTQSPSSSSTATLSSPEPLSDRQTPDSDEMRGNLDMAWSKHSLDRNMNAVATSTVQALSTLMEVLTPDPGSKLDGHFQYEGSPIPPNPNWYAETDDSDTSSYPLFSLSPVTSPSETTPSPSVKSPLTSSVSDSSISTLNTKSEIRVVQKVHFSDSTDDMPKDSYKEQTKTKSSQKKNGMKTSHVPSNKRIEKSEHPTSKHNSPPQTKAKQAEAVINGKQKENVRRSSTEKNLPTQSMGSRENSSTDGPDSRTGLSNGLEIHHDYAMIDTIDPMLHDYAVLEPESHPEFFGYCQRCTKPVIGMETGCFALDCVYHHHCFTCSKCSSPLSGMNFYTAGDQVLCENDYWSILDTCHLCSLRIRDRVLRALDCSYHPDCFRCSVCSECLDGVPYMCDTSSVVYCIPDYHKKYAPKCAACDDPIVPEQGKSKSLRVKAMDKSYHLECYKCEVCGKQLASRPGVGEEVFCAGEHLICKSCNYGLVDSPVMEGQQPALLTGTVL